ncbi:MAG: 1-deoxy-D-xylulose-5-phosphate synthase [Bacteroidales bacterium]|nr:1-deoxy-D-xylulose-5-phosphate synthase [Bacteroidales bacterium]
MKEIVEGNILKSVNSPRDIKSLSNAQLHELCSDVRRYIIEVLSENPGHLASSLGTVELSVAIHKLFDIPKDTLVWDVGHQAYAHKVLTERKEKFKNIRKINGPSGFPRRKESPYDSFGTGHASTSISASLGMALADKIKNENKAYHIAVIGDGSMTGGEAFEALNHAGSTNANLLVILNDNGISIDEGVGALGQYLTKITTSRTYNRIKNRIWNALGGNKDEYNTHRTFFKRILFSIKSWFGGRSNFFEALNFRYFGPIDGNDLDQVLKTLQGLKTINGPKLLHIITKKGKGLPAAENNPTTYHAPGLFNSETGALEQKRTDKEQRKKFQEIFGGTLVELAEKYDNIACITPAMLTGSGLNAMRERFPDRTFDVGIAEEHAVTFSAGLSVRGIVPFCCIYSSFLQRGFDQIIHDIALQKLPVVLCLDRAGLVGEDGATHHGVFDLAYLNMVPDMVVSAPKDEIELQDMMLTAYHSGKPFSIRYPRGKCFNDCRTHNPQIIEEGRAEEVLKGEKVAILSLGTIFNNAKQAAEDLLKENITVGLYNMRFLKPLDTSVLNKVCSDYEYIVTVEDGALRGGFGWTVEDYIMKSNLKNKVVCLGIQDGFVEHGSVDELQRLCNIDAESIKRTVINLY